MDTLKFALVPPVYTTRIGTRSARAVATTRNAKTTITFNGREHARKDADGFIGPRLRSSACRPRPPCAAENAYREARVRQRQCNVASPPRDRTLRFRIERQDWHEGLPVAAHQHW